MKILKTTSTILRATTAALLLIGINARAGVVDLNIPDGNLVGVSSSTTESGLATGPITVAVTMDITGGNNGDLYGYLSYDGMIVTLLNRPGVTGYNPLGYTGSGFNNVTFSDAGSQNINTTPETDGVQVPTAVYNVGTSAFATGFNGSINPNGTWTLFLADESAGGGQAELVSWSLSVITAVPEPINIALGIFAGLFILSAVWRTIRAKKMIDKTA